LLYVVKLLGNQRDFDFPLIPAAIVGAVIYIGMCLILSGIAKLAEHWVNRSPKVIEAKKQLSTAGGADLPKP
jgi:glutamate transport system permease protein